MRKALLSLAIIALALAFSSCGLLSSPSPQMDGDPGTSKPADASTVSGEEEITDNAAKELFEKAVHEIIMLAAEEPSQVITTILGDDIEVFYEEKIIDGTAYYETTAKYEELQDYYSEIFSGDALSWILSTKFTDVDGTLYCSPAGGATGWSIENTEVSNIGQSNGSYAYEAAFNKVEPMKEPEETTTSRFTVEKTENGYRISSIDYSPDLLEK